MAKELKLNLNELNVESFTTSEKNNNNIRGGVSCYGDTRCNDNGSTDPDCLGYPSDNCNFTHHCHPGDRPL